MNGRVVLLVGIILIVGVVLRLVNLGSRSLWEDEAWTDYAATARDGIIAIAGDDPHPISFYWLYQQLPDVFKSSDTLFRLPSAICSIISMFLMVRLLRLARLESRISLLALTLYAVMPVNIRFAQEARAYALAELLSVAVLTAYLSLLARPRIKGALILALITGLSAHLDGFGLAAPFAVLIHAAFSALRSNGLTTAGIKSMTPNGKADSRTAMIAVTVGMLLASPYYVFRFITMAAGDGIHAVGEAPSLVICVVSRLAELSPFGIGFEQVSSPHRWVIYLLALGAAGILGSAGLTGKPRKARSPQSPAMRLFAMLAILTPLAYIAMSVLFGVHLIHRKYLLLIVPALAPLFAIGAHRLFRGRLAPCIVLLVVAPLAVSAHYLASPGSRADWRNLFEAMRSRIQPGDRFIHEMQENYPLYSFGAFRAYARRNDTPIESSQLIEYRPTNRLSDKIITLGDQEDMLTQTDRAALMDFIRSNPNCGIWTLSADWICRGRSLDLSTLAVPEQHFAARGVSATLWRVGAVAR
ncbi:MAG: glycosyltransferase family 39 protein [Phycisphaerae bacterium]|nr:glycosyltransferase family 39 protein [Phycisphaerae bacterium]